MTRLPARHLALGIAVAAVWGSNFVVIKIGLGEFPSLLFATLRFVFALLPWIFFLPRPAVSWRNLAAYGALTGAGQFGLIFIAMRADISPGLTSLVIQSQVFITILLSMWRYGERPHLLQAGALILAVLGIVVIGWNGQGSATPLGLFLVILAAFNWSIGNLLMRQSGRVNMVAYVVWSSLFAVPPLLVLSLIFDGADAVVRGIVDTGLLGWACVFYQSIGNSIFGYGSWGWLLARHPTSTVTPLGFLVPIFGMGAAALVLGEPLQSWKILAAVLVISGLILNLLASNQRVERNGASADPHEVN